MSTLPLKLQILLLSDSCLVFGWFWSLCTQKDALHGRTDSKALEKSDTSFSHLFQHSLLVLHIICHFVSSTVLTFRLRPQRIKYKCDYQWVLLLLPILIRHCAFNQNLHDYFKKEALSSDQFIIFFLTKGIIFIYNCAASKNIKSFVCTLTASWELQLMRPNVSLLLTTT